MAEKLQNLINHVALLVDKSSSMQGFDVVKVFDAEIQNLRQMSIDMNQETRISVYLFGSDIEVLVFDMDVMRMGSLRNYYRVYGNTKLVDAACLAIEDLDLTMDKYGDHAYLVFAITDGQENASIKTGIQLRGAIDRVRQKGNWTVVALVPDYRGRQNAESYGFGDNIALWNTSSAKGIEEVGSQFRGVTTQYMTARASGLRTVGNLFADNVGSLTKKDVVSNCKPISDFYEFHVGTNQGGMAIRDFVQDATKRPYSIGSAYYELTKPETIQAGKVFLIQDKSTGKVYDAPRDLLGVPVGYDVKINAGHFDKWRVFVQSTSVNRKLVYGTSVLVRR